MPAFALPNPDPTQRVPGKKNRGSTKGGLLLAPLWVFWTKNFCRARGAISWHVPAEGPNHEPLFYLHTLSLFPSCLSLSQSIPPKLPGCLLCPPIASQGRQRQRQYRGCALWVTRSPGWTTRDIGCTSCFFAASQSHSPLEVRCRKHLDGWEGLWKSKPLVGSG